MSEHEALIARLRARMKARVRLSEATDEIKRLRAEVEALRKKERKWRYNGAPEAEKDARHLCTIMQDGMVFVGVRAWDFKHNRWMSNGEPTGELVIAFMPIPPPARGRWVGGILEFTSED